MLGVKELIINKYIETRWLSEEFCISRILQRWDELIEFFTNEGNKDSKEILELLNEEVKVYLQFLIIFLKDINQVNTLFQKREALVSKIQDETTDIFNSTINLILLDEYRTMIIDEKLKLFEYIKGTKSVIIGEKFIRNPNQFVNHISSIYKGKINLGKIKEIGKQEEIAKNMLEYVKRLAYKMTTLFPFNDQLLQAISCLNPESFNFINWKWLAERYTNITQNDFPIFYKQLEKFEKEIPLNKKLFDDTVINKNLMKFYNNKDIKQKYGMISKLATSLLCLPFSNSEIERMFSQFKLTKTQLRTSLSDETVEGLMLWKMNMDLVDINDKSIMKQLCMKYKEVFEKVKENEEETKENKSFKRKSDYINTSNEQIDEIRTDKEIKLTSEIEEEQDELSQDLIRCLKIEKNQI